MVGGSDLRHFAIDVLQHLVYGFELGDGVLVDLRLLVHEVLQSSVGVRLMIDPLANALMIVLNAMVSPW
jgi:hypothetical protein